MGVLKAFKGLFVETIYGREVEHDTPYLTRISLPGLRRARIHIFHRGDADPDPHDHPWDFWTYPLVPYWEQVYDPDTRQMSWQTVRAFRLHFRKAEHAHRIVSALSYNTQLLKRKKIVTLVWTGKVRRRWGFVVHAPRQPTWVHWRRYVYGEQEKESA